MAFKYNSIVPWGRSFEEYTGMFGLAEDDLGKKILGCGDGPAGFNSVMHRRGKRVVSVDPIYQYSAGEISRRIEETFTDVLSQTRKNRDKFVWTRITSVEALGEIRMAAMREFLADYDEGRLQGRYVHAELPALPFGDAAFDLALSSHFLFLYTDNLTLDFHIAAIGEMLRVAREARIFPILDMNARRSEYVDEVIAWCGRENRRAREVRVNYEFQKNGNTMLVIEGRRVSGEQPCVPGYPVV